MNRRHFLLSLLLLWTLLLGGCGRDLPQLQPLPRDAVILAFGDSLTYGTGTTTDNSYPAVLERLSGHSVINTGIPGEESPHGLARLPQVLDEYQPALMILCLGGNDMLRRRPMSQLQANLEQMVGLAQERGIQVVLLGVPEPSILGLKSARAYYTVAEQAGIPLEDEVIPEVLSDTSLKSDRIHPNAEGYHRIAEALYRLLRREGAIP